MNRRDFLKAIGLTAAAAAVPEIAANCVPAIEPKVSPLSQKPRGLQITPLSVETTHGYAELELGNLGRRCAVKTNETSSYITAQLDCDLYKDLSDACQTNERQEITLLFKNEESVILSGYITSFGAALNLNLENVRENCLDKEEIFIGLSYVEMV